ncbi:MAG: hypothetical protein RTS72_01405 [Candidatus Thorarchaeota archaeon]
MTRQTISSSTSISGWVKSSKPIGKWSALNEVYGSHPEVIHIEESLGSWGFSFPQEYGEVREITTFEFSKSNGVIQRYFKRATNLNGSLEFLAELTIDGYVSSYAIIGSIVGAGVILIVIGIMAKRRRVLPV